MVVVSPASLSLVSAGSYIAFVSVSSAVESFDVRPWIYTYPADVGWLALEEIWHKHLVRAFFVAIREYVGTLQGLWEESKDVILSKTCESVHVAFLRTTHALFQQRRGEKGKKEKKEGRKKKKKNNRTYHDEYRFLGVARTSGISFHAIDGNPLALLFIALGDNGRHSAAGA